MSKKHGHKHAFSVGQEKKHNIRYVNLNGLEKRSHDYFK